MKLFFDKNNSLNLKLDSTTGFLTAPVTLARTGVQYYMGIELGLTDRAVERIGVFRSPVEVFDKESMQSFVNLVVTNDHPNQPVTTDNVKQLQVGSVSQVKDDATTLSGIITITDKVQIEKIKNGKVQVSVGYQNDLKEESGVFGGEKYEFVQTNIKANHLAIVDFGRCGPDCKLTTDNKGVCTVKVTVAGITFDTENQALVQAINQLVVAHDEEVKNFKKKEEEDEEEKKKMKKEKESADAKADILEKSKLSDTDISTLVTERAELLSDSRAILGDKMPKCVDCPKEIKTLVVDHVFPDLKVTDKDDDYLNASYDIAVANFKKAAENNDNLKGDFKKDKEVIKDVETNREAARAKYMKDTGFEVIS